MSEKKEHNKAKRHWEQGNRGLAYGVVCLRP